MTQKVTDTLLRLTSIVALSLTCDLAQAQFNDDAGEPTNGVGQDQELIEIRPENYAWVTRARWAEGVIPVCWEGNTSAFTSDKQLVQQVISESWDAASGLDFEWYSTCPSTYFPGVRIRVADVQPNVLLLGPAVSGKENGMTLNFEFVDDFQACQTMRDHCIRVHALHEFGHAIGFAHEHMRPDNIDDPDSNCDDRQLNDQIGEIYITTLDLRSTMHYCGLYSRSAELSQGDILAVAYLYGPHRAQENDDESQ